MVVQLSMQLPVDLYTLKGYQHDNELSNVRNIFLPDTGNYKLLTKKDCEAT